MWAMKEDLEYSVLVKMTELTFGIIAIEVGAFRLGWVALQPKDIVAA